MSVPKPWHFFPMHAQAESQKGREVSSTWAKTQKTGHLSPLPTLPIRGSFPSSVRAQSGLALPVLVSPRCGRRGGCQPAASAPYLPAATAERRAPDQQVGGTWLLCFSHLDQSPAEVSKWQPPPRRASLLQKRQPRSAGKPAPELLQWIKAFVSFKRGNGAGNGDVLALTLASPIALSESSLRTSAPHGDRASAAPRGSKDSNTVI